MPGPNDLPSRPPPSYVTLSIEFFRAGLRLSLHPFLSRALVRLNVAPMQLNANAYRILVSCYILWKMTFGFELPFRAFQNLFRMKSAPSSAGSYYFQGYKGTFNSGCPDSDKQFKHLWFYAGGRWLRSGPLYDEVLLRERVPVSFRDGYVWTRRPHTGTNNLVGISTLKETSDPERNQSRLLSHKSLQKYKWIGQASSDEDLLDRPGVTAP